jgi:hypothetical protein
MTIRTTARSLLAALTLLAQVHTAVAVAAVPADEDEDAQPVAVNAPWALSLATLVDQQSTRGFFGELGYDLTKKTSVRFAADATSRTMTNPANFNSQGVEAGAAHDFARFRLDGAVAHWQNTDINSANELRLGGAFHFDPWTAGLRAGYRRATFDPIATTVTTPAAPLPQAAVARCDLNNTAFGLDGRYQGRVWGGYVTATTYRYADAKCGFQFNDGSTVEQQLTKAQFAQLAAAQAAQLTAAALHHVGRQEMLLDGYVDAGASWKKDDFVVSLDYSRLKDYFAGATSNTYSVTGTADLGDHAGIDCTLGITQGGGVTEGGFVGFAVRAKF